ncbi:class I SAM-dependent methyltransferase, partial [Nostocoides japonicum]|uniref:class I SAM-dependent methyltransferase n=1 Tax=Nostocoides japonicum TaxID=99481 RepID=UPI00065BFFA4
VPLAEEGHDVTVVDPSPDALASLRRRAEESGVSERVTAVQGDADHLADAVGDSCVDLVCCHGILEVVDDPDVAVAAISRVLAPGGVVSVVAAQRLATVLAHALTGRFDQARAALDAPDGRWGPGDPLARRFDRDELVEVLQAHDLAVTDAHGVRIVTDLVPSACVDSEAERLELLALEDAMAAHPDAAVLGRLGAVVHVLATRA